MVWILEHPVDLRHQSDTHTSVKTIACTTAFRLVRTAQLSFTPSWYSPRRMHTYASAHSSFLSSFSPSSSLCTNVPRRLCTLLNEWVCSIRRRLQRSVTSRCWYQLKFIFFNLSIRHDLNFQTFSDFIFLFHVINALSTLRAAANLIYFISFFKYSINCYIFFFFAFLIAQVIFNFVTSFFIHFMNFILFSITISILETFLFLSDAFFKAFLSISLFWGLIEIQIEFIHFKIIPSKMLSTIWENYLSAREFCLITKDFL